MRVTGPLLKVLRAFLDEPDAQIYGLALRRATRLPSGTLYPILERLEANGLAASWWEEVDPREAGRPRRRFYRLTGSGMHEARQLLQEYSLPEALLWTI
jgi:PadR family transcriptional regulator PadR